MRRRSAFELGDGSTVLRFQGGKRRSGLSCWVGDGVAEWVDLQRMLIVMVGGGWHRERERVMF